MGKLIIFNFDGTSNDPEDAVQGRDRRGAIDDNNITNVLKFHLLCGGHLRREPPAGERQISLYYQGIGTYGHLVQRLFNAGLAVERWDVATILRRALADFEHHYRPGDRLLLTGFSRGAALARRFAALINDRVTGDDLVEAVFDTVAAIGLPHLRPRERPTTEVVFEHGHTLPPRVIRALHLVALDDKRKAFQPTLMNREAKVTEVWFSGAHADVGGGYYFDGLADLALRFMLEWIAALPATLGEEWRVELLAPDQLDYLNITDGDAGYRIDPDDIQLAPDCFGRNHQQARNPLVAWATLRDRRLCVLRGDQRCDEPALVFHSVAKRIGRDRNYLPRSLKNAPHRILYERGTTRKFTGIAAHRDATLHGMRLPESGRLHPAVAFAHKPCNHTGIYLQKGVRYRIQVPGQQQWQHGTISCGGDGWSRDKVRWGLRELAIRAAEPFRRLPGSDWFSLAGSVSDCDDHLFPIGRETILTAPATGELCLFANDHSRAYGNKRGKLQITLERLEPPIK